MRESVNQDFPGFQDLGFRGVTFSGVLSATLRDPGTGMEVESAVNS